MTSPSSANPIPSDPSRNRAGITSINVSTPIASHASGNSACRHRAIPDLPELDPPLSTIT